MSPAERLQQVAGALRPEDLGDLWAALLRPSAMVEWSVVLGCLGLSWLVVRLIRGTQSQSGSVWLGERVIDGVLFPVLSLVLALVARREVVQWVPLAVFRVVIPALTSLLVIRLTVRVLGMAFPHSAVMRVVERRLSWLAWVATALWVTGLLPLLLEVLAEVRFKMGGSVISLRDIIEGALSSVLLMVLALWVSAAIETQLMKGSHGAQLSVRKMAANSVRAVLILVGLLLALSAAGIDLTALSVLGGALGVGVGLGLQKLAANYVSGFVVLAEQSLRIGDLVRVDGFEGRISDIHTRYTVIRSIGGRESIVPNEVLLTQRIENASLADPNLLLSTVFQVAYGTDIEALRPALLAEIIQVPRVVRPDDAAVHLSAFAADGLELTVYFWIADPEQGQSSVRSAVNLALLRVLTAHGIQIPYPQRVVHMHTTNAPGPTEAPPQSTPGGSLPPASLN